MFLELAELIGCFVAGSGASVIGALLINKGKSKPKMDPIKQGTFKWACKYGANQSDWYFICPKCDGTKKKQPDICECHEYYNTHFHFECDHCSFNGVMRTKDDP